MSTQVVGSAGVSAPGSGSVFPVRVRRGVAGRAVRWATADSPWELADLVRLVRLVAAGGAGLAVCWYAMSGQNRLGDQLPWLAGAVASVVVAGFGVVLWLLAGVRAVHRGVFEVIAVRRAEQAGAGAGVGVGWLVGVEELAPVVSAPVVSAPVVSGPVSGSVGFVVGVGMSRVHRVGCALVVGKAVEPVDAAQVAARGLGWCGVCCSE